MTNCINTGHPQYKVLLELAKEVNRNSLDLYIDTTKFNNYFDRFPNSMEELDNGLEFIKNRDYLSEDIANTILINSPVIERTKSNVYTFKVSEGTGKIKNLEQAYATAKRLVDKVNNKFVSVGQNNITRVSTENGEVRIIVELNFPAINNYIKNSKIENENTKAEYEAETNISEDTYERSDYDGIQDFDKLMESGEITQFCSR